MVSYFADAPSWKSIFRTAFLGQIPLGDVLQQAPALRTFQQCPHPSLSCGSEFVGDTCCINYPGGQFALTQFWNSDPRAGPPGYLGPNDTWTIHGLWPDHCDGRYDSVCDCGRSGDCSPRNRDCPSVCNKDYSSITRILQKFGRNETLAFMSNYWKGINGDEHLWQHEWSSHGSCVSTLEPKCYVDYQAAQEVVDYMEKAVEVYKTLPTFEWLAMRNITPSSTRTYELAEIQAALSAARGVKAVVGCDRRRRGELREIWYHFHVRGSLQSGEFVASDPDFSGTDSGRAGIDCPRSGIRYLPKQSYDEPTPTTTAKVPTGTAHPTGKGHLVVALKNGGLHGCLISNGRWYNTPIGSSCASFKAKTSGDVVTLRSSRGPCGLRSGSFECGLNIDEYALFQIINGNLILAEKNTSWSADNMPRGTAQELIRASDDGSVQVLVQWRAL